MKPREIRPPIRRLDAAAPYDPDAMQAFAADLASARANGKAASAPVPVSAAPAQFAPAPSGRRVPYAGIATVALGLTAGAFGYRVWRETLPEAPPVQRAAVVAVAAPARSVPAPGLNASPRAAIAVLAPEARPERAMVAAPAPTPVIEAPRATTTVAPPPRNVATAAPPRAAAAAAAANAAAPVAQREAAAFAPVAAPARARPGPSFDCRSASSLAEDFVCLSPRLAAADRAMAQAYQQAVQSGAPVSLLRLQQEQWRADLERAALDNPDALIGVYDVRIAELREMASEAGSGQP